MFLIGLVAIISVLALFFNNYTELDRAKRHFVILAFVVIGFLIAFRGITVGADTWNYANAYSQYSAYSWDELFILREKDDIEIGYLALIKVLSLISSEYQAIFIFEGILVAISYGFFIIRNTDTVSESYIAVLAYLAFNIFSFQLSGLRQSIAMAICIWSYETIKQKKIILSVIIILIASTFHASAVLFIPALIISLFANSWKLKIFTTIASVVAYLNINSVIEFTYGISDRFSKYGIEETGNGYVFVAVMVLILLLGEIAYNYLAFQYEEEGRDERELSIWYNINYICFALWCMRLITRTAERPSLFYIPATIILITKFERAMSDNSKRLFYFGLACMLIVLFFYRSQSINYTFCW